MEKMSLRHFQILSCKSVYLVKIPNKKLKVHIVYNVFNQKQNLKKIYSTGRYFNALYSNMSNQLKNIGVFFLHLSSQVSCPVTP